MWNYRVIEHQNETSQEPTYSVHEVYYDELGDIEGWTADPISCLGASLSELRSDILYHHRAFQHPVLKEKTIKGKRTLVEADEPVKPNAGHYFELMDRSSVAMDYFYQIIGSNPLLRTEESLRLKYDKVEEALAELYMEAGKLDFEKTTGTAFRHDE